MRKIMRKTILSAVIVIVIVTIPYLYHIESNSSSPFHNTVWHNSELGSITSVVHSNSTFFFSNFTTEISPSGKGTITIGITAINISQGNTLWQSQKILVSGIDPLIITSNLDAPKMWTHSGSLYVMVYNASNTLDITNFNLYIFNTSNGVETGYFGINYGWMQQNVSNLYAPSVIETPKNMYLSFITQFVPITGPTGPINATFHTIKYSLSNDSMKEISVSNHTVPGTIKWELNSMYHIHFSGDGIFSFGYDNFTLIENLSSGNITLINTSINQFISSSNGVYGSRLVNNTVTVYSINLTNGNITEIFNFTNQNLGKNSNAMYTMYPLNNNRFSFVIQGDLIGLVTSQYPYVTYVCYSSNGTLIWNNSVKANNYGDFSQVTIIGDNEVMLSTETGAYTPGSTYSAHFLIKNIKSGSTIWSNSYNYNVKNSSGLFNIFTHEYYGGILTAIGGYVLFFQGNGITCSHTPNS